MPKTHRDPAKLGARLAPRVAHHVNRAMADHLRRTAHTRARIGAQAMHSFVDTIGRELDTHGARLFTDAAEAPDMPERLRPLLRFIAHGRGELKSLLSMAVYQSGLGTGLGSIITNAITPYVARLIALEPNATLPPTAVADATVRGFLGHDQAQHEAAYQGISATRFKVLTEAARNYPALGELLELRRRGLLNDADTRRILARNAIPAEFHDELLRLQWVPPSPAALADQVVRGIIGHPAARDQAAESGMHAGDFDKAVLAAGEPPGLMELLEAFRRGIIDRQRLEHGIRQSRYRNEWIDVIEALRHQPMSAADAIQAAVQGHLTVAQARAKAEDAGLNPSDFTPIYETHGEPPGVQEMLDLLNRGEMTEAEVEQGIRESRYKNKYVKAIIARRRRIPPQDSVGAMVADGTLTHDQGVHYLRMLGFNAADAGHLIAHHHTRKTTRHKALTAAQVIAMHGQHLLSTAETRKHLEALDYPATVANELLRLAEAQAAARIRGRSANAVHTAFVRRRLSLRDAEDELTQLGYVAAERDRLTHAWELERDAAAPHLTPSQVIHAGKTGIMAAADVQTRLRAFGYSDPDVLVLMHSNGIGA